MKSARGILEQAFEACQQSEEIWLAAVKLESECDELKRARQILAKARTSASSPRVMMKSAKLDWSLGDLKMALALLDEGKSKFNLPMRGEKFHFSPFDFSRSLLIYEE